MLEQFYRAVLPETGCYALFDATRKAHIWAESIGELTRKTEARIDQQGLYFATCSFNEPTSREASNALSRRALCFDIDAGEEKYAKHGDEVYPTQRDALADLMRWIQETGLKPSLLVSSGAGLHVYFRLTEDASPLEWLPAAKGLKGMALATGLRIDATVTADIVRILRPPGTLHKNGARVRVLNHNATEHRLADLTARCGPYLPKPAPPKSSLNASIIGTVQGPPRSAAKVAENCAAFGHAVAMRGDVPEPYWRAMLGIFKFAENGTELAHEASRGHPEYDFHDTQTKLDRWTAGPTRCDTFEGLNPEACASCRFRGKYTSPILLGELNDQELVREGRQPLEPAEVQTPVPDGSEFAGAFGAATEVATPIDPWHGCIPDGHAIVRTPTGYSLVAQVVKLIDDETKEPDENGLRPKKSVKVNQQFAAVPFWFESWAPGKHDGDQALATYCVYDKHRHVVSRYTMPTRQAAQRDALLGTLASQNVQVYPSTNQNKQLMEDFVKASLERIRGASQRQKIIDRFGTMFDDNGGVVVAHGRHVIQADGSVTEAVIAEKLKGQAPAYRVPLPAGNGFWSRQDVVRTVRPLAEQHIVYLREFYSDDNFRPYQLAIMLAWASPMMAFMQGTYQPGSDLPRIGLTVSLYSTKSGIGKTAALHAAALAFGDPNALVLQLDRQSSTDIARQTMVQQCGTLPSFMDEMEDVEARDLAALVSSVGNGASRRRLNGKTMQLEGGIPLALVNLMTSNKSHREIVAADRNESAATQLRLLEIDCTNVQPVSLKRSTDEVRARSALQKCAGAVGTLLHMAMCSIGQEKLNQLGQDMALKARLALDGRQDGRILWRALGAMLAVRAILRTLNLEVFDDKVLIDEFRIWHDSGYQFNSERLTPTDPVVLTSLMLTDMLPRTVFTRGEADRRLRDFKPDALLNDRLPSEVVARVILEQRCAWVRSDAIREWAVNKRVSYRNIINSGIRMGYVTNLAREGEASRYSGTYDMLKGTTYSTGARVPALRIDLGKLSNEDLVYERVVSTNVVPLKHGFRVEQTAEPPPEAAAGE